MSYKKSNTEYSHKPSKSISSKSSTMNFNIHQTGKNLKEKISRRIKRSQIPILVYLVLICSMVLLWYLRDFQDGITMDFFAELFGAAFTLFIIDVLLVRSKTKRWKNVQEEINYLISRNVNRLRDGISTRVFGFSPTIDHELDELQAIQAVRDQRNVFLIRIAALNEEDLIRSLHQEELFSDNTYDYFNEKADEIWAILNMKYSDDLHPEMVSLLINLHVQLKDICSHIRQYLKIKRFPEERKYYSTIGLKGVSVSMSKILLILNRLKEEGYSEAASLIKST
ncbi:hypothetical protein KI659_12000 [Litoribacter alkaliphilus]|uniref:Uncharacterized protein n=1 Tax=Litoribacter ruber TaxID=702568 RepID=A0AAP2CIC3_9BACT|nr:hypothetical protein [Litoribacter alkaliphilus]MBS9524732.1 hypothetical protein [Litoribacter alkaliphilus]